MGSTAPGDMAGTFVQGTRMRSSGLWRHATISFDPAAALRRLKSTGRVGRTLAATNSLASSALAASPSRGSLVRRRAVGDSPANDDVIVLSRMRVITGFLSEQSGQGHVEARPWGELASIGAHRRRSPSALPSRGAAPRQPSRAGHARRPDSTDGLRIKADQGPGMHWLPWL